MAALPTLHVVFFAHLLSGASSARRSARGCGPCRQESSPTVTARLAWLTARSAKVDKLAADANR